MHQLVAIAIFLVLTLGKPSGTITVQQQVAYMLGAAIVRVVAFLALQAVVYFGAKTAMPKEQYASYTATRLNYLTLAIIFFFITAQAKH